MNSTLLHVQTEEADRLMTIANSCEIHCHTVQGVFECFPYLTNAVEQFEVNAKQAECSLNANTRSLNTEISESATAVSIATFQSGKQYRAIHILQFSALQRETLITFDKHRGRLGATFYSGLVGSSPARPPRNQTLGQGCNADRHFSSQ